jgi:hypothetical protein
MSEITVRDDHPKLQGRVSTGRTWAGNLVSTTGHATHYLHLYAFPCDRCNGPVIVGSLGRRENELSRETEISEIGAVCLACGGRPETMIEPLVGHGFRPVEWEWVIKKQPAAEHPGGYSPAAELSPDVKTERR